MLETNPKKLKFSYFHRKKEKEKKRERKKQVYKKLL